MKIKVEGLPLFNLMFKYCGVLQYQGEVGFCYRQNGENWSDLHDAVTLCYMQSLSPFPVKEDSVNYQRCSTVNDAPLYTITSASLLNPEDRPCRHTGQFQALKRALSYLNVPKDVCSAVLKAWAQRDQLDNIQEDFKLKLYTSLQKRIFALKAIPRRFRCPIAMMPNHPASRTSKYLYGCYMPLTDLCVSDMGHRNTGEPNFEGLQWLDDNSKEVAKLQAQLSKLNTVQEIK